MSPTLGSGFLCSCRVCAKTNALLPATLTRVVRAAVPKEQPAMLECALACASVLQFGGS